MQSHFFFLLVGLKLKVDGLQKARHMTAFFILVVTSFTGKLHDPPFSGQLICLTYLKNDCFF